MYMHCVLTVADTSATLYGRVHDVTDTVCWAQNSCTVGRVFATFKHRFLPNRSKKASEQLWCVHFPFCSCRLDPRYILGSVPFLFDITHHIVHFFIPFLLFSFFFFSFFFSFFFFSFFLFFSSHNSVCSSTLHAVPTRLILDWDGQPCEQLQRFINKCAWQS